MTQPFYPGNRTDDKLPPYPNEPYYYPDARIDESQIPGGVGGGSFPFPQSGIVGWTKATGDGAGKPAYLQIKNPGGSGVDVWVFELYVSFIAHASSATIYWKRTNSPVTLTSPNLAALMHLDEQDVATIHSVVGGKAGGSVITEANAHGFITGIVEGNAGWRPYAVRGPMMAPLIIKPGEAWECSAEDDNVNTTLRLQVVLDERPAVP